jgi:hypothetical protein
MTEGEIEICSDECPCTHNDWDNLRVRKAIVTLLCRVCRSKWKAPHPIEPKCPDFYLGNCPLGASCPLIHIHRIKASKSEDRMPTPLLPPPARDQTLFNAAKTILSQHPQGTAPSEIMPQIMDDVRATRDQSSSFNSNLNVPSQSRMRRSSVEDYYFDSDVSGSTPPSHYEFFERNSPQRTSPQEDYDVPLITVVQRVGHQRIVKEIVEPPKSPGWATTRTHQPYFCNTYVDNQSDNPSSPTVIDLRRLSI